MNKYHIYQEEARGKYSVIFKARRKRRLEFVAIKRMDKARKQKILNEARVLEELRHQNIIRFFEHMETKNHMWAVTEYCPGGDLLRLIEQDKSLPEPVVKGFAVEILRALAFAHSRGVVVCDLKPATVLLNEYGSLKLGDFGSAQQLVDLVHSHTEKKKGTPCYMAPELFEAGSVYSFASDLWAVGCILYELAQGTPPFVSPNLNDISTLARTAATPKVDFFSSDFNNLLEKLLVKEPEERAGWRELFGHSWLKGELQVYQMPRESHFEEYKRNKRRGSQVELLRASQQFEGYGQLKQVPASDRREQFVFEADQRSLEDYEALVEEQSELMNMAAHGEVTMSKRPAMTAEIQDSTTINIFLETLSSKNLPPLDDVIQHQSDNSVKPIIGNKEIEVIESCTFNKRALGFQYIEPDVLAQGIVNGENENQLKRILEGMGGEEKINVLGYFESIIQNSDVANHLFKPTYIAYYMKLLKNYKQSALRAKMCQILGLLIRHATAIDPDILKYGIITGFLEALKDKSEKVRRKAMAALGELLFYGATQVDQKVNEWDLSMNLIHSLLKLLKSPSEDQIVKIYCCKSIENITAQAKEVGLKFAQFDTLQVLAGCFNTTKNEGFRSSICCTIHHILLLNPTLREMFFERVGLPNIIEALNSPDTSSKTQQILLWILLVQFDKSPKSKLTKAIAEDETLFAAVLSLLEVSSSVVKGRVFLYIYFVLEGGLKRSLTLLDSKLFQLIQRQGKDGAKYETQCLQFVLVTLYENFEQLLKLVEEDVRKAVKGGGGYESQRKHFYIGIVSHMISSPIFEELFEKYEHVQSLLGLLNNLDCACQYPQFVQIKSQYMALMDRLLNNSTLAEKLQEPFSTKLTPLLVGKILKASQNDIRFSCMKFLLYLVNTYLSEENIYDSTVLPTTSSRIAALVNDHLIPQLDFLLAPQQQQDTVASMTLSLVAVLFQISKSFVARFCQTCQLSSIFRHYGPNSSANVLKATQLLVGSGCLTDTDLLGLLPATRAILAHYVSASQDIFLEYPLDILKAMAKLASQEDTDGVWELAVPLQANEDTVIREKAEALIEEFLKCKKTSGKGKWDVKSKRALENYESYLKLTGREHDQAVVQNFKKPTNRYK